MLTLRPEEVDVLRLAATVGNTEGAWAFLRDDQAETAAVLARLGLLEASSLFGLIPTVHVTEKGAAVYAALPTTTNGDPA